LNPERWQGQAKFNEIMNKTKMKLNEKKTLKKKKKKKVAKLGIEPGTMARTSKI